MRTTFWLQISLAVVALTACAGDGDATTDDTTGTVPQTTGGPGETTMVVTTGDSAEPTTDPTTSTTDPSTTEPDPTTGDPPTTSTTEPDTTTGEPAELTCENYCNIYADACADFSEYQNAAACLEQCSQWPVGLANATADDSLGCRLYHVTVASTTDPNVHCPHAGPSGAEVCVALDAPTCKEYCATYFANCTEDLNLYVDEEDCATRCAAWYPGTIDDVAGDTVGCRLYHGGAPAIGEPDVHCPHAGPGGAGVCVVQ